MPNDTNANIHALQKHIGNSKRNSERKTAYAVNRKGSKPIPIRLTIDTEPDTILRIKETPGVPAYRNRNTPKIKPRHQQNASARPHGKRCKDTFLKLLYCAIATPQATSNRFRSLCKSWSITRHGYKFPQIKCTNTILQNLQKFKLF